MEVMVQFNRARSIHLQSKHPAGEHCEIKNSIQEYEAKNQTKKHMAEKEVVKFIEQENTVYLTEAVVFYRCKVRN